jgi:hypothetical protein
MPEKCMFLFVIAQILWRNLLRTPGIFGSNEIGHQANTIHLTSDGKILIPAFGKFTKGFNAAVFGVLTNAPDELCFGV